MSVELEVTRTGPLALVEDLGRLGSSGIGVGRSGAADRGALRLANRALANDEGAAAVEVTFGGLEVTPVGGDAWICLTGAPAPVTVAGRDAGPYAVVLVREGETVRVGTPPVGLRSYLAVRGGVDVTAVLGSRSRDVLAGLGPEPLAPGDRLPVGPAPRDFPGVEAVPPPSLGGEVLLRAVRGPRDAWVADADLLVSTAWTASERTNRVGMRLAGGTVPHVDGDRQLPSEGACRGAVQVPPSGEPVLFLADHPVTGGYPVVAVVVDDDVDRAAQVRPGQPVRLTWVPAP
ncbi:MAG: biotin-dependent carboxyltransferase family protein [Nocardioidaceae bacterium]|nr:biotin-dependent carboxyltransferase family protein [Nocardioidaceae bacterium]